MSLHTTAATRFDSFNLYRTSYKKIGDHDIEVNVLVPKGITSGTHPLLVKWHGGGLTAGTAAYPDWFSAFLVPFLHRNNSITVLPNYRLAPEHTGNDILEDIADFWTWFRSSLPAYVASKKPSIKLDFSKVLVSGDSAGGWLALQSILSLPQSTIKACLIQYPVTNAFPTSPDDTPSGQAIPSKEILDEFLTGMVPGTIISSAIPPARSWMSAMLRAHGRWDEFFGKGKHLMPDTRLEDAKFFVPTYIIHGKDDSVVPLKWTHAFVEKAKNLFPETRFKLVTPPGDHGFDEEIYEENEPWLRELLKEVEEGWMV
ncbi:alpha/beta-hydrolase [Melanomma pulvis-pyrius CBS 109.77]|uniref:Alpha/beta-hydrolase n=1 Tax=Melanomma pulvis-pyrius CBS 109.77 TaxID=1314802 RepID=A0A6A6X450_9PLEO|nr:alpha/beta-hydrolase [Melanomma pulvis-pyrius CBS 109.77]